jgi:hypothetical protein
MGSVGAFASLGASVFGCDVSYAQLCALPALAGTGARDAAMASVEVLAGPEAHLQRVTMLERRPGERHARTPASRQAQPVPAVSGMGCGLCGSSRSRMAFNA